MSDEPQPEYCDCDGFHDGSCKSREIKRLQDKLAIREFAVLWMHQNVHKSVQDAAIRRFPWILECKITDADQGV